MAWLDEQVGDGHEQVSINDMAEFTFEGVRIPLMDRGRGIRKPAFMRSALSIMTAFTTPGEAPRYLDQKGPDGLQRYKHRDDDLGTAENRSLQQARLDGAPLIWFVGSSPHLYVPVYPVWVVGDEPDKSQFVIAFDDFQRLVRPGDVSQRAYVERITQQRLHQPVFRAQVLQAYEHKCAICRLRYPSLLDAAHILRDGHPRGQPVVSNGLSLCKIHHAAYDGNFLGVRPDLVVEVRPDIRNGSDGPMLLHGIQEMEGIHIEVPRPKVMKPDPLRLEERYDEFRRAS